MLAILQRGEEQSISLNWISWPFDELKKEQEVSQEITSCKSIEEIILNSLPWQGRMIMTQQWQLHW